MQVKKQSQTNSSTVVQTVAVRKRCALMKSNMHKTKNVGGFSK